MLLNQCVYRITLVVTALFVITACGGTGTGSGSSSSTSSVVSSTKQSSSAQSSSTSIAPVSSSESSSQSSSKDSSQSSSEVSSSSLSSSNASNEVSSSRLSSSVSSGAASSHSSVMESSASSSLITSSSSSAAPITLPTTQAPIGFEWSKVETMSDEFESNALDTSKWRDSIPTWKGRPPAEFLTQNVKVNQGHLELKTSTHPNPNGNFTMGGAAVMGLAETKYGYFEARLKASKTKMSSTFWLHSDRWDNEGTACNTRHQTEIDILETLGGWPDKWWTHYMHANTHYKTSTPTETNCAQGPYISKGVNYNAGESLSEGYHTYAVWWMHPNKIVFYFDGKLAGTVYPSNPQDSLPFNNVMSLRMVVETYDWQVTEIKGMGNGQPYPTPEELEDASINTAYYDYVRTYQLRPTAANLVVNPDIEGASRATDWLLSDAKAEFTQLAYQTFIGDWSLKLKENSSAQQTINVTPQTDYKITLYAKNIVAGDGGRLLVLDENGNSLASTLVNTVEFQPYTLSVNSGVNKKITLVIRSENYSVTLADNVSVVAEL
jgi:beta-porphyranase